MTTKPHANFLITSHTGGARRELKEDILCRLIESIHEYFEAFVVVSSASDIPVRARELANACHQEPEQGGYHGNQERELLLRGLEILATEGKSPHFRIGYDFVIDETNIGSLLQISGHGDKKFVCARDSGTDDGIRSNIWFGDTGFTLGVLRGVAVNGHMESAMFNS